MILSFFKTYFYVLWDHIFVLFSFALRLYIQVSQLQLLEITQIHTHVSDYLPLPFFCLCLTVCLIFFSWYAINFLPGLREFNKEFKVRKKYSGLRSSMNVYISKWQTVLRRHSSGERSQEVLHPAFVSMSM